MFRLAIPIMGTSFVQMAYNMTDMIWVGRIGTRAVAATGTAGFYSWLAMAFVLIPKIGAEVGVAQSVGKQDMKEAKVYIKHSFQMVVFLALAYASVMILFRRPLIGFFNLGEADIVNDAITYLVIIAFGMIFSLSIRFSLPYSTAMGKQNAFLDKLDRACYQHDPGSAADTGDRTLSKAGGSRCSLSHHNSPGSRNGCFCHSS